VHFFLGWGEKASALPDDEGAASVDNGNATAAIFPAISLAVYS
jgi:hypothetical protein